MQLKESFYIKSLRVKYLGRGTRSKREREDMGTTFFRSLCTLEQEIVYYKGKHNYAASTRNTLLNLIRSVEENDFIAERNVIGKFVCRTFRSKVQEQVDLWNGSHEKRTSSSGIRSSKSRMSDNLYSLFGDNFLTVFLTEDQEGLRELDNTIIALQNKDYLFDFLVTKGVSDLIPLGSQQDYDLDDCKAELELLYLLSNSNLENLVSKVNLDKLAYLKMIGNQPLLDYFKVNTDKAELLKALHKYGTTDSAKLKVEDSKEETTLEEDSTPQKETEEYAGLKIQKGLLQVLTTYAEQADLMADCDANKVRKVRTILENFYTEEGLAKWLGKNIDPLELNNALSLR